MHYSIEQMKNSFVLPKFLKSNKTTK